MVKILIEPSVKVVSTPVVFHNMQVGLQGREEELQDFGVCQQLRRSSSNPTQPLEKIVIR